ncbi:precorrin-6A/cobalt-precorrin-6A reductase [Methylobacterium phyllostachyos]|uniref:Precorrin-6A/cobalt-precorrin-6A reductase n=1 Tax=Methylobacterium phyllostachyos TaxID=582672 RepID=A0A1G9WQE5_9HYPH|nr:cobalt-precorrin-6A reductase [Methylobacterium phyllostachyos]SDM86393.1 precorrin-6A/cobalt-precorrin-6A reductase [Methylobacterium phyllostachyos]
MNDRVRRILILGGTGEASALARALAGRDDLSVMLSLAGRTSAPKREPVPTRIGGFGGAEGLARYLSVEQFDRLIDATHPFAARISSNAARAAAWAGIPLLAIRRPAWSPAPGDFWTEVEGVEAAVSALGPDPRRVFLTIGRQEAGAFAAAPQHAYWARTVEPLGDVLPVPHLTAIEARGPFNAEAEAALMRSAGIEIVVSKNSGGAATYGKIAAARALAIPVVMVRRPDKPAVPSVADAAGVLRWLDTDVHAASTLREV